MYESDVHRKSVGLQIESVTVTVVSWIAEGGYVPSSIHRSCVLLGISLQTRYVHTVPGTTFSRSFRIMVETHDRCVTLFVANSSSDNDIGIWVAYWLVPGP